MSTGRLAAERSLSRVLRWRDSIVKHAKAYGHDPAIVAGILSRETNAMDRWCLPPPAGRLGDNGFGHGPMQIDKRSFPEWCARWAKGELTLDEGIRMGCEVLQQKRRAIRRLLPNITPQEAHRAHIAAYNCGEGNVRKALNTKRDVDIFTTGKNYSLDVVERAAFFRERGFVDAEAGKEGDPS